MPCGVFVPSHPGARPICECHPVGKGGQGSPGCELPGSLSRQICCEGSTESAAGGRRADYPEAELLRQTSAHVPAHPCSVLNADFTQSAVSTVCGIS